MLLIQDWIFLKFSEYLAVKFSTCVVSDNDAITNYIAEEYKSSCKTIAYGGDHAFKPMAKVKLDENLIKDLSEYSKRKEEIEINLNDQKILYGNKSVNFDLDPAKKKRLLEGLDDIGMTLEKTSNIDQFEKNLKKGRLWK